MFSKRAEEKARRRRAQDRNRRPALEDLESRTVLSTLSFQTPAVAAAHAEVARAEPRISLGGLRFGQATIGGTASVPVAVNGALTIQNFAVTNNQLTATG